MFGIGESFCNKDSNKFLKSGEKIYSDAQKLLHENKRDYHAYFNILEFNDKNNKTALFGKISSSKIIDSRLYNPSTFHKWNTLSIAPRNSNSGEVVHKPMDFMPSLFNPKDFNVFICGVDINGGFIGTIDTLTSLGYYVTVYSDIIKPYSRDTITYLIEKAQDKSSHVRFGKS